jgi:hypothetical protein
MSVLNLTECLRVTKAGIRLYVDSDCNEELAAALGQICMRMFVFYLWEATEGNGDRFSGCFFHDNFSDTSKFSVVRQANIHYALSNCILSLFVAVNNLEHPDASFNSDQVPQSISRTSSYSPLFRIGNLISCLLLSEVSTFFPEENQASKFPFELNVDTCRLEICSMFFSAFNI